MHKPRVSADLGRSKNEMLASLFPSGNYRWDKCFSEFFLIIECSINICDRFFAG